MKVQLSFHRLANKELESEAKHYLGIDSTLEADFIDSVEQALAQVTDNPKASQKVIGDVRRKVLKRFPYSIFYLYTGDTIRVLAIANERRRPFYWIGRR
jgi:toxin ParE1/3/4